MAFFAHRPLLVDSLTDAVSSLWYFCCIPCYRIGIRRKSNTIEGREHARILHNCRGNDRDR